LNYENVKKAAFGQLFCYWEFGICVWTIKLHQGRHTELASGSAEMGGTAYVHPYACFSVGRSRTLRPVNALPLIINGAW
jgi:hypothetical protein